MAYVYLAVAIIAEVIGTTALKASAQFTKLVPSTIVVIGYAVSFYLLTLVLRTIPLGVTYAIWSGIGIVLIVIAGAVFYEQIPDLPALIGIGFIIAGTIIINLFSNTAGHG
ncbi:MAG: multidrug efflux SMR transporter [Pseudomonadota bacterium]